MAVTIPICILNFEVMLPHHSIGSNNFCHFAVTAELGRGKSQFAEFDR